MTRFLFIRHGETDWNRQQRFQGQIDVPLNAAGHEQARRLGERLAAERPDRLLCSDLQRARETAAPLAAAWGLPAEPRPRLREQAFGILEGLDFATIRREHADLLERWSAHQADYALPGGGESLRQFHDRVNAEVDELAAALDGQTVAVVTHGGVLDILWRRANGLPLHGMRRCEIPNTGTNGLRWEQGALVIEVWADAAHLPPE